LPQQQYIFIYTALLEHHLYGDTEVEASEVNTHIEELNQRLPGNVTGMEHEFRVSSWVGRWVSSWVGKWVCSWVGRWVSSWLSVRGLSVVTCILVAIVNYLSLLRHRN